MKNKLINVAGIVCILLSLSLFWVGGCQQSTGASATTQPTDPLARLTVAMNLFTAAETTITTLDQQGYIPAADKAAVADAVRAVRAALDTANANVASNPTVLESAVSQAEAALGPVLQMVADLKSKGGK